MQPIRPGYNRLRYEISGFGTQIVLAERIVNFIRRAQRRLDDPNRPFYEDPNMRANNLVKELFERNDVVPLGGPAIKHTHYPGFFNTTTSILPEVDTFIPSLTEPYVEASQVVNSIADMVGAIWRINPGSPTNPDQVELKFPSTSHSGIVIKAKPESPTEYTTIDVSYILEENGWSYTDSMRKEDGFSNRLYSKTGANVTTGTSSESQDQATPIAGIDIAQQFTVTSARLRDLSFIISGNGIGDVLTGPNTSVTWLGNRLEIGIVPDENGRPGNTYELTDGVVTGIQSSGQPTQVFLDFSMTPGGAGYEYKRLAPGDKAWIIIFRAGVTALGPTTPPCGTPDIEHSLLWHHDGGNTGVNAVRSVCQNSDGSRTPGVNSPGEGWTVQVNSVTYTHKFFDAFSHPVEASDQDSIKKYGLVESYIDASWITEEDTMNQFLSSILQFTAKPRRVYEMARVTIPYKTLFLPGQLVSVIDEKAGLTSHKNIVAEIQEVNYEFNADQTGQSPLGATECDIKLIGYIDFREDFILAEQPLVPLPPVPPPGSPPPSPIEDAKLVVSSVGITAKGSDTGTVPANINDNSFSSRWAHTPTPTWVQVDLGEIKRVAYVKIAWHNGTTRKYNFDVQVSTTGATGSYSTVFTSISSGTSTNHETYNFADIDGRYVRINVNSVISTSTLTPITNRVVYQNGPVYNAKPVKIYVIWWGSGWNSGSPLTFKNQIKADMTSMMNSQYFNSLWQYGGVKKPASITHVDNTSFSIPSASTVTFVDIVNCIRASQTSGLVPNSDNFCGPNAANPTFYWFDLDNYFFVMIPPNKVLPPPYGGAHSAAGTGVSTNTYGWGATTYNTNHTGGVFGSSDAEDDTMQAITHEWIDSLTDPFPSGVVGTGAYSIPDCENGVPGSVFSGRCEIAQICGHIQKRIGTAWVEAYYSDQDGGCVVPGVDNYRTEPVATQTAALTELEVWGQPRPGGIPPPPAPPSPVPPPAPPAPPSGSLDSDGIRILNTLNNAPGKFHKTIKDLAISGNEWRSSTFFEHDCQNDRGTKKTLGGLTYWNLIAREGSFASTGETNWTCRPTWISDRRTTPAGVSGAKSRGYLATPDDPKNIEFSAILRIVGIQDSSEEATFKWRGDTHSDQNEKTLQGGSKFPYGNGDGAELFMFEKTHPNDRRGNVTFVSPYSSSNYPKVSNNKWVGIKTIIYNINHNQVRWLLHILLFLLTFVETL